MKISLIGAGQVGGQTAFLAATSGLGDVVLVDTKPGLARGKSLDIGQSLVIAGGNTQILGTESLAQSASSDVVVVTAGLARRPGMTRHDLLTANGRVVTAVVREALEWSPDATIIIVTNPINTMAYLAYKASGLPPERIIGMAGLLDNARFTYFIARELAVPIEEVTSWVIGDHGDHLVPVVSQTRVSGMPLAERMSIARLEQIYAQTRSAGTEILTYLQEGSAYFAPGVAICRMVKAVVSNEDVPIPCSVYLNGEYGTEDVIVGVPAVLGQGGLREVLEFDLSAAEREQFSAAVAHIRESNREALHLLS